MIMYIKSKKKIQAIYVTMQVVSGLTGIKKLNNC